MFFIWTAGYFYKDWRWVFYPEDLSYSKFLDFYASKFNFLEINSSFYRMPGKNYKIYLKYDLVYAVKANKVFTHFRKFDEELVNQFMTNLIELIEAWKLQVILFQFPYSFKFNEENLSYLKQIRNYFWKFNVYLAFEFRHLSWFRKISELEQQIVSDKITVVHVDGRFWNILFHHPFKKLSSEFSYFRFHGRWYRKYFYDYSEQELKQLAKEILEITNEKAYISFNNTTKWNAPLNALKLKEILDASL